MLKTRGSRVGTSVWTKFFVCLFVCLFGEGKIKGFRGICALRVPISSCWLHQWTNFPWVLEIGKSNAVAQQRWQKRYCKKNWPFTLFNWLKIFAKLLSRRWYAFSFMTELFTPEKNNFRSKHSFTNAFGIVMEC